MSGCSPSSRPATARCRSTNALQNIYPRYLVPEPMAGPDGLTLRPFRDDTPYQGEELVFEQAAPEHFLARCSRKGVTNSGTCLLERRIGDADITFRFPRDWLSDWKSVAAGIDKLMARLHPDVKLAPRPVHPACARDSRADGFETTALRMRI